MWSHGFMNWDQPDIIPPDRQRLFQGFSLSTLGRQDHREGVKFFDLNMVQTF